MDRTGETPLGAKVHLPPAVTVPPHEYSQREIAERLGYDRERALQVFTNAGVESRRFCVEGEGFTPDEPPEELADRYAEWAPRLSADALRELLAEHGVPANELSGLVAVSSTGNLCPGLSTRLMQRLELDPGLHALDVVGHGCAGGVTGLRAAAGMVRATGGPVALICVEICSACYTVDESFETLVANAICADGASAVLLEETRASRTCASFTTLGFQRRTQPGKADLVGFRDSTERSVVQMGSELREAGPELLLETANELLENREHGTGEPDMWLLHPGGPAILDRVQRGGDLNPGRLEPTLEVYRELGNMSSPTVWFVVRRALESGGLQPGDDFLMGALGPGLTAEMALGRLAGG